MKGARKRLGTDQKSENLATSLIRIHIFSSCWYSLLLTLLVRVKSVARIEGGCFLMSSSHFNLGIGLVQDNLQRHTTASAVSSVRFTNGLSPHILPCFSGHLHPFDAFFLSEPPYFWIRNRYYIRSHIILNKVHSRVWQTQKDWLNISKPQFHNCYIGVNHVIASLSELQDHIYKELSLVPGTSRCWPHNSLQPLPSEAASCFF